MHMGAKALGHTRCMGQISMQKWAEDSYQRSGSKTTWMSGWHLEALNVSLGPNQSRKPDPLLQEKGKGLLNCVYKPCPTTMYSMAQPCLQYDTLHHCFSSSSSLENGKRELGHLCYCRNCKNTSTILLREHAYPATGNSRVHYLKSDYIIQLIAFWWNTACMTAWFSESWAGPGTKG